MISSRLAASSIRNILSVLVAAVGIVGVAMLSNSASRAQPERPVTRLEAERLLRDLEAIVGRLRGVTSSLPSVVVTGYIAAVTSQQREGPQLTTVYVPRVDVVLEDATGTQGPQITDLSGRFTFRGVKPGKYRLCWKAPGFVAGCRAFDVASDNVHLSDVRIFAERDDKTTLVHGRVRLADGTRPRLLEPLAGLNSYARVELLASGGTTTGEALVNNFGQYVLPAVPIHSEIALRVRAETLTHEQRIRPEAQLHLARAHRIDLTLPNLPPKLTPIAPADGSARRLKTAKPGSTVQLVAKADDPDGDALTYTWLLAAGSGTLSTTAGDSTSWTLPAAPGLYSVTAIVTDGRGGGAKSSFSLRTDELGVPFSGVVAGTDVAAIAGATVDINGQQTVTAADGSFSMRVRDADRFVVNIRRAGYALASTIHDGAVLGGRWTLTRGTTISGVNPATAIDVVDRRDPRNCPGPASQSLNYRQFPKLAQPQWQDGKGNVVAAFDKIELLRGRTFDQGKRECGPGIRVRIPANALVDQNGQAPGPGVTVDITLSTVDLQSPNQMPGDYTVLDTGGSAKTMESYGAGSVDITAGNRRFNLRPGAEAEVVIPVDPSQLAAGGAIAPTIPILFYDERRGVWVEEGQANRSGNVYVARVKHFSTINTDLVKTNQACVRVDSPTLPANYNLEITIPIANAAPKIMNVAITNTAPSVHVIYNLPINTNIILVPIRPDANPTPIGTFVVNTGGPQNPQSPNLPAFGVSPNFYPACATKVALTDPAVAPPEGEFLHGLTFSAVNLTDLAVSDPTLATEFDNATLAYYQRIDPRNKRPTLAAFQNTNGFPTNEIRTIYANSGDLGFGRDMHCKKSVAADDGLEDVACYVTNYGNILTPDSQDAVDAVAGANPVATVAMEYSRIESDLGNPVEFDDPQRVVKFYVYSGDGSELLRSADLDSGLNLRARPIPQLCMVCHGGVFPTAPSAEGVPVFGNRNDVKLGSRFLPFDLHYFTFAAAPNDKPTQQAAFKQLNENIVKATQPGLATDEVITEMYSGGVTDQKENFVIAGWNGHPVHRTMYRDVVGRACRTCHVANSFPALNFRTAQQAISDPSNSARLGNIEQRVCVQGVMPHAKRTHEIFWTSIGPHMPSILQVFGDTFKTGGNGWNGQFCGTFSAGGASPPSLYTTTVYPIWLAKGCTGCHLGNTPPAGLNVLDTNKPLGDPTSTFPQLLQAAQQLPAMPRDTPNNPANSYLSHKIKGTQGGVGGSGVRMPQGCSGASCLSAGQITTVDAWINSGAPPP